jgi:hypothetical protein
MKKDLDHHAGSEHQHAQHQEADAAIEEDAAHHEQRGSSARPA